MTPALAKKRYESLDVLRGLTVTFMCMCNNPGNWGKMFRFMQHAPWDGCRPVDLIYPFFIFCMGCAMAFSLSKFEGRTGAGVAKVIKRSIGIGLVGFLLYMYPFIPTEDGHFVFSWEKWVDRMADIRIFGVLMRIACSYLIAGLLVLWLKTPKKIAIALASLCVIYTGIQVIFGTEPGVFTLEGTVVRKIDTAILSEAHMYHGYAFDDGIRASFDPEGPLGSLDGAASCLLGYLIGLLIRKTNKEGGDEHVMVSRIFVYGVLSLGLAEILNIWIPISKPLWSASYVFYAGGWAMIALAFLTYCIDIKGVRKPFTPFKVMGMNAMMAFVLSAVINKSYQFVHWSPGMTFGGTVWMSFLHSCIFALVIMGLLWILYKRKIFIRL